MSRTESPSLRPLTPADVTLTEGFWAQRQQANRRATIPHVYEMLKRSGAVAALRMRWKPGRGRRPHPFFDSDLAKWLEGASYTLAGGADAWLSRTVDRVIALLAKAQRPDGYLNSFISQVEPDRRWANLRDRHELYCAGHLIEAGVAHHQATGKTSLLNVVRQYADLIAGAFGPGRRRGYPGHEEIELALVRLYRATGDRRYLSLARHFVDARGRRPAFFEAEARTRGENASAARRPLEYWQAHRPVRRQARPVGHAVRALYLYSAMADLAGEDGDAALLGACRRIWDVLVGRQMYVTGGVGQARHNEGFTADYDLPNDTAYAETCATIALALWARRMANLTADARYADVMERALYNGVLSGVSLDGKHFFYDNPLAVHPTGAGSRHGPPFRQEWFGCACCPTNVTRTIASVGSFACAAGDEALCVHLYAAGQARAEVAGINVTLRQETDYPWDGRVKIAVDPDRPARFDLLLRVPGWCRKCRIAVNGRQVKRGCVRGYARLRRQWRGGDVVTLAFDMPVERIAAHPKVSHNVGRVALRRGPIVYCIEQADHADDVHSILLPRRARLTPHFQPDLLGGAVILGGPGLAAAATGWKGHLYRPDPAATPKRAALRAIPYCLWANRTPGPMTVWIPQV